MRNAIKLRIWKSPAGNRPCKTKDYNLGIESLNNFNKTPGGGEVLKERYVAEMLRAQNRHCLVASHKPPSGDLARNPDVCPYWESNQ